MGQCFEKSFWNKVATCLNPATWWVQTIVHHLWLKPFMDVGSVPCQELLEKPTPNRGREGGRELRGCWARCQCLSPSSASRRPSVPAQSSQIPGDPLLSCLTSDALGSVAPCWLSVCCVTQARRGLDACGVLHIFIFHAVFPSCGEWCTCFRYELKG